MEMGQGSRSGYQPIRTLVVGPLEPYVDSWRRELAERGYAPHSITAHAQLMAHLSGWLVATGRSIEALTDEVIEEYLRARRTAGYQNRTTARGRPRWWGICVTCGSSLSVRSHYRRHRSRH
jgi:hypothetical protein